MSGYRFEVDVYGPFMPGQLHVRHQGGAQPTSPSLERMVEETWQRELARAQQRGAMLFNGRLAGLRRYRREGNELVLEIGETDYRRFIGTNFHNAHRMAEFGSESYAHPVGVSTTVITVDGWLLHGRRGMRVACHPGYVHTFGGMLEASDERSDGRWDAFGSARRELREETGLKDGEIAEVVCLGLARDPALQQPELMFDARVTVTREEIVSRVRPDDAEQEHAEIVGCRDHPEAIVPFVRGFELIAPLSVAALCLHGRLRWGEAWYQQTLATLRGEEDTTGGSNGSPSEGL